MIREQRHQAVVEGCSTLFFLKTIEGARVMKHQLLSPSNVYLYTIKNLISGKACRSVKK